MLYDGDCFTHRGHTFKFATEYDDTIGEPWREYDGHGIVSDWVRRDKLPGERVLAGDRGSKRYYDVRGTMRIARRDGWGCGDPAHTHRTDRERAACAVDRDYQRLRAWLRGTWYYVVVYVQLVTPGYASDNRRAYLGGVESDAGEYLEAIARELADEIIAQIEVDDPNVVLSEN